MYRVPGVRDDEAPKRGAVDHLEVGRIGRLRAPIVAVTAVAALALANVPPSGRVVGAGEARNIELLRGRYLSADRSGLVPIAPQIFVNGATNAAAFARLGSGPRILAEMERLNLRHVYLYPKEVKVIPYDALNDLRDPAARTADVVALAALVASSST